MLLMAMSAPPEGSITCSEFLRCRQFLYDCVSVDTSLLDTSKDKCFCSSCYLGPSATYEGLPEKLCGVPVTWARFGLASHEALVNHHSVRENYYPCYHGTTIDNVRSIISSGQLLHPGEATSFGLHVQVPDGSYHDGQWSIIPTYDMGEFGPKFNLRATNARDNSIATPFQPNQLYFTSPSLSYASQYSEVYKHSGGFARIVIEARQSPESISVLHSTLPCPPVDPYVPADEMEWFTARRWPAIVPVAVLIQCFDEM
jgi:hypothetical protein